ncbi:unnamed protein product [Mytilus coruscus]|uniref:DNA-directed DNA polymerase n=1 Tax=Mytilus coruscus TaxID=42192 RepID=A0A6J8AZJ6_MYTCO|nr:unnamed protein product [Mytilus coruscus]
MKLSKIPECFGLKRTQKGYFPHLFSSPSVFDYKNGCWPTPWYYGTDSMSEKGTRNIYEMVRNEKHERFDFQDELYKYATEDVRILRAGSMKFRRLMMQETYTTTITERRNNVKTTCPSQYIDGKLHLRFAQGEEWIPIENIEDRYLVGNTQFQESDIALVPSEGYITDSFSKASIQWLEFLMYERRQKGRPLEIIHGLNGREHREGPYRLDGYHTDGSTTRTAFEFMGCVYHGCPECFPNDRTTVRHPVTKHSMSELYYATKKKENDLKKLGYRNVCIWEHEFRDQLKTNSEMREFVSTLDITDRLRPRSSFVGGRTNTIKLYHEVTEAGETIEYFDYTSLYPYVNKYCRYPVGHPTIITSGFRNITSYFGLAKVKVLPPRRLFHPVLPYLSNGKLKFPLCKTCAETENQDSCRCEDRDRIMMGTWCTPELNKALSKGYSIIKIYEVYHFEETTVYDKFTGQGGLFAQYVNMFLKLKQQASGFPNECETDEQKMEYIARYAERGRNQSRFRRNKKKPGATKFGQNMSELILGKVWSTT